MIDKIQTGISYWHVFLGGVTPEQWFTVGSVAGGSALLMAIVGWVKRHNLKKHMDKLEDYLINVNLWLYTTVLTLGSFVVAVIGFGVNLDMLLPYLGNHGPQIFSGAVTLYVFSKEAKKRLEERKAKKLHVSDQLIDGFVDVKQNTLPTGVEQVRPPQPGVDMLQL